MKVVFTGGGTGGHFYPLIAVAEQLNNIIDKENIAEAKLYYFSDTPYDEKILYENSLNFRAISAAKFSSGLSLSNLGSLIKVAVGCLQALFTMVSIYPDVVFSKGGYAAFPTLVAARLLGIPTIIHESDSVPGKVSLWSARFAKRVAVSYKQDAEFFNQEKIVHTGQPIRTDLESPTKEGAYQFLGLNRDIPVVWVIGGSLGAQKINYVIEESLAELLPKYQIVHQTGKENFEEIKKLTDASLMGNEYRNRYHIFPYLNKLSLKMIAGVTDIVITRAGSILFEIANWNIPAIVIPITHSSKNHQIKNAYNYAREGACTVIEENNLSDSQLIFEINRIYDNQEVKEAMIAGAQSFDIPDAAMKIAKEIAGIALSHDR